jgi:hypothetical protein
MRSKFIISALVMSSVALSGTFAYAQTSRDGTVGGPAARQDTGAPLIRKPTTGEAAKNGSTALPPATQCAILSEIRDLVPKSRPLEVRPTANKVPARTGAD